MVAGLVMSLLAAVTVAHLEELTPGDDCRRFRLVGVNGRVQPYAGLKFTALETNSWVSLRPTGIDAPRVSIEISRDGKRWETYPIVVSGMPIRFADAGAFVYFRAGRGGNETMFGGPSDYMRFEGGGKIAASGNVTSILDYRFVDDLATDDRAFCLFGLFWGCSALVRAPELPSSRVGDGTYMAMFRECTGLLEAPALPAVHVGGSGYGEMFYGCTAITNAPLVAATWADDLAFYSMFYGCSELRRVEVRMTSWKSSTGSGEDVTTDGFGDDWMTGVSAGGTFVKPPALPTERGTARIPSDWTVITKD